MDDRLFRDTMGKFATGVTVLTTEYEGQGHGMTANAFMSVSLSPKLIVVSIAEKARFLEKLKASRQFAVNILGEEQQALSKIFAGKEKDEQNITFQSLSDVPVLADAIAQISCEIVSEYIEGDHTLFIAKVIDIALKEEEPLVFFAGQYRNLEKIMAEKER